LGDQQRTLADGRYELFEVIGTGGMATVYRGRDHRLGVLRAIKVLAPAYAKKKRVRARFEAEARTMAVLDHPNIVRVYDVGSNDKTAWIVMELVEGGSLLDRIDGPGVLVDDALSITGSILEALDIAHGHGVVHRDIKPHNILMSTDGIVRITDFGIARSGGPTEESFTKTGTIMGTWAFMAPEQRVNAKGVDHTADIYGVGATLFSMATRKTPMDLFAADLDPEMLSAVPEPLLSLIRKSTRYNREERYPSAKAMLEAVRLRQSQSDTVSYPIRTAPPPSAVTASAGSPSEGPPANETFIADNLQNADRDLAASITPPPFRPSSLGHPQASLTMDEEATILPDDMEPPAFDIANPPKNRDRTVLILIVIILLMVGGLAKRLWKSSPEATNEAVVTMPMGDKAPTETVAPQVPAPSTPPAPPPTEEPKVDATPAASSSATGTESGSTPIPVATVPSDPEPLEETEVVAPPGSIEPPKLIHAPAKMARMGSTMFVTAQIKNLSPIELRTYQAITYFRANGTARWTRSVMTRERSTWSAPIPITPEMEGGLEYVIKAKAEDSMGGRLQALGSGTNKSPHYVRITSP
jgi:serine/threonine protein kinase